MLSSAARKDAVLGHQARHGQQQSDRSSHARRILANAQLTVQTDFTLDNVNYHNCTNVRGWIDGLISSVPAGGRTWLGLEVEWKTLYSGSS
jgi:hypothetical protein